MNCDEIKARVDAALDDGMEFDARIRTHLCACETCRRHAAEMEALGSRLSAGAQDVIEASDAPDVDGVIAALASRPAPRRRGGRRLALVALACAAGWLLVFGVARNTPRNATTSPRRTVAGLELTPERREAARLLEEARAELIAELSKPVAIARVDADAYGKQYVDGVLTGEMSGIETSVRSLEVFLLECIPMPTIPAEQPGSGARPEPWRVERAS